MTMYNRNPDIAFTRNPIRFTDIRPLAQLQRAFNVMVGASSIVEGVPVYVGHYTAPATIDISEICDAYVPSIPDPEDGFSFGDTKTMIQLEGPVDFQNRYIVVTSVEMQPLKPAFYALRGGVSPQNFRRLAELDADIFSARLLDKRHNFFLTTRTHGWRIVMDELELYPLTFVNLEDTPESVIEVKAVGTEYAVTMENKERGIYAIDIEGVRGWIAREKGYLGSVFDVVCDGYLACQIVIKEASPELTDTVVKFRNSLGAYELLHLTGTLTKKPILDEMKSDGRRYESSTGRFERMTPRRSVTHVYDTASGFKDNDELGFLLDMAASDEVYIRRKQGWVRVIPSLEGISATDPQLEPTSVNVTLTLAEARDNQTPDITSLDDFERPRIFSDEHTDEFN